MKLQNEIKDYITDLFTNLQFEKYFEIGNQVLNEKSIINEKGQKLIPDKIIITKNETIVIDFKTGQTSESHKKQLNSYIKILRDMNFENVRGELFYTEKKETVLIS